MLINLIEILKTFFFFKTSYSNNVFPDPLNKEEEEKYIELLLKKDKHARDILIERNLRLVAHIAKKYENSNVENDDLISIGTIGLIKGIDSYSLKHNTKITTYCARCIENEILMYFRNKKKYAQDVSFTEPIDCDKDGNTLSLIDVMADERSVAEDIEDKLRNERLYKVIDGALSEREKEIIYLRYGLDGRRSYTQREVAKHLGISRSYVSRIEKKALETLKEKMGAYEG